MDSISISEGCFMLKTIILSLIWLSHLLVSVFGSGSKHMRSAPPSLETSLIFAFIPLGYSVIKTIWKAMQGIRSKSISRGFCRSSSSLVLAQFINGVRNLNKHFDDGTSSSLHQSILLQMDIIEKAKKLNNFYQTQVLLCTASIFITLSSDAYSVIERVQKFIKSTESSTLEVVSVFMFVDQLVSLLLSFYWLLNLVHTCESFYRKMENFNDGLLRAVNNDKALKANCKLQLCVMNRTSFIFTTHRLFPIGYPLITKVVAAAATYLVILLGFSDI
uniref:Gustatory receptor n=1 Tax=Lygus hesperus TaxID=30085 RepID=A0A0K8SN01_LYGHE